MIQIGLKIFADEIKLWEIASINQRNKKKTQKSANAGQEPVWGEGWFFGTDPRSATQHQWSEATVGTCGKRKWGFEQSKTIYKIPVHNCKRCIKPNKTEKSRKFKFTIIKSIQLSVLSENILYC